MRKEKSNSLYKKMISESWQNTVQMENFQFGEWEVLLYVMTYTGVQNKRRYCPQNETCRNSLPENSFRAWSFLFIRWSFGSLTQINVFFFLSKNLHNVTENLSLETDKHPGVSMTVRELGTKTRGVMKADSNWLPAPLELIAEAVRQLLR